MQVPREPIAKTGRQVLAGEQSPGRLRLRRVEQPCGALRAESARHGAAANVHTVTVARLSWRIRLTGWHSSSCCSQRPTAPHACPTPCRFPGHLETKFKAVPSRRKGQYADLCLAGRRTVVLAVSGTVSGPGRTVDHQQRQGPPSPRGPGRAGDQGVGSYGWLPDGRLVRTRTRFLVPWRRLWLRTLCCRRTGLRASGRRRG
jgi:hypothetical protein